MSDIPDKLKHLQEKLDLLLKKQEVFLREVYDIRREINMLKSSESKQVVDDLKQEGAIADIYAEVKEEVKSTPIQKEVVKELPKEFSQRFVKPKQSTPSNIEKFIGENLINKIGIAITVIGVGIGTKYSIEHQLISPLTRIILGYITSLILLGFGMKLKKNYENYSAVLVSGAMAAMYFVTFSAYSLYELIPQLPAFILMVVFTVFTVVAALNYNREVIALIGLVGAYAVPFLLSDGSGRVAILFSYITIINGGILTLAFKKYWKLLYYSSFLLTWLIYFGWYTAEYKMETQFGLALIFLSVFFITFYLTFLVYKLKEKEKFEISDIIFLIANSFISYGLGYAILTVHETGEQLLGFFTLCNAFVHFAVCVIVYKQKLADRNLFYFISGLVLVFITLAIPVQLDGNWVTLLWAGQAALLFWIGRTKNVPVYEKLSYPLMILAFLSMVHDWGYVYNGYFPEEPDSRLPPLININFFSAVLFIGAFSFIHHISQNKTHTSSLVNQSGLNKIVSFLIPAIILFTLYYSLRLEIENYWSQLYSDSAVVINQDDEYPQHHSNDDLLKFKIIWVINYSMVFLAALSFVNFRKLKNQQLGLINLGLNALAAIIFLTQGLWALSELRESFLEQSTVQYFERGSFKIIIRYISFTCAASMILASYYYTLKGFIKQNFKKQFDSVLHIVILWVASSELIHWLDIAGSAESYKLGLSILWGVYALLLIILGIWKRKKYLRIGAIILFTAALAKLFTYDIAHLTTIAKTIVFVSLGVLLLIISFLYNKYKNTIFDDAEN